MKVRFFALPSLIMALVLALSGAGITQGPQSLSASPSPMGEEPVAKTESGPAQVTATLRSSPVMFIENVGQFDERAHFQVRGAQAMTQLTADAENVELVGQIGGVILAVAVQGSYAYIGVGPRLVILDVSDPAHPVVAGQSGVLPDVVMGVAVAGDYAYVATGGGGLRIINIANSAAPFEVGFYDTPGDASDVAVAGSYAYVTEARVFVGGQYIDGGLRIINVSNPAHPIEAGFCRTPGSALGVAVMGNTAYVADLGFGLRVIDVSNPAAPSELGSSLDVPGSALDVAVAGNYAYVAHGLCARDECTGGLALFRVSDPAHPTSVGAYWSPGVAWGVAVAGDYAYVTHGWNGLRIISISNPARPVEVGFYGTPGVTPGVAVAGNYAYVADHWIGLRMINVSNPHNPTEVGFYHTPGYAQGVAVTRNYVYVTDRYSSLRIINVSDPTHPAEIGFYNTPGYAEDVVMAESAAYVADGYSGLRIINVSNPANPTEVGFYDTPGFAYGVAVAGNTAYVADSWQGLRIVGIANSAAPVEVGFYDTPGTAYGVMVAGNYAYVADGYSGLRIINVSNPVAPSEVGFYDTLGEAWGVVVAGNYGYVADRWAGLHIINVSDPARPYELGYYDTSGYASDVAVAGSYAYVAEAPLFVGERYEGGGLRVIDVSNPAAPVEVGFYNTPGSASGVAVAGDYVYIADGDGGLLILRFTGGPEPTYSISGRVRDGGGNPIPGVTISDGAGHTATTDSNGNYTLSGLATGTYTITPYKSSYFFSPSSLSVIVPPDATGQDFTGTLPTYSISGQVRDGSDNPIPGVTISDGAGHTATTDSNGNYTLSGLAARTYTITPFKSGYTFSPASRTVIVPPDAKWQDFTGTLALSISHIEITQATQDEGNSVPLIAGKPTFVWVYVDCGESCTSLPNVTGVLRGYGPSGELPGSPLSPLNGSITAYHEDWHNQRGDLHKTLNFRLPLNWRTGTITLTAEVNGTTASQVVSFQPAQTLRVAYVPIHYDPPWWECLWAGPKDPDSFRIALGYLWAWKVYPTARIEYVPWAGMNWDRPLRKGISCSGERDDETAELLLLYLTSQLRLAGGGEGRPQYIYGWLPERAYGGRSDPAWWLGGAGKAAFGDDCPSVGDRCPLEGEGIFAHEIAHLMGRRHTKDLDPGSDWPYTTATIQEYGLDVVSSPVVVKNPDSTYDYMSGRGSLAEGNVWTSSWTYEHIYSETLKLETASLAAHPLSTPQSYFIASGLVYTDDTAILYPIWVITSTTPENPPEGTQYCLEAQDASGAPLVSHCFDLTFMNYETGGATNVDGFNLMLPYPVGVARIVLKKGAAELAVRTVSAHAPVAAVASPNGGETWSATGIYTVTWTASDADHDPLTYSVLYSPDGSNWVPVGIAITETQLAVNSAELTGGNEARVRVLVSDGVNTSADESDAPFTVGRKGPQVFILSPESDVTIWPGAPLWLQGYAYDLEDGTLGEEALNWSSNRDGDLGTGTEVLVTLSPGQHIITLSATDGDGNTAITTINVFVGYKARLPLILHNR